MVVGPSPHRVPVAGEIRSARKCPCPGGAGDHRASSAPLRLRSRRRLESQQRLDVARGGQRLVKGLAQAGHVAHLAPAPRFALAVEVQLGVGQPHQRRPVRTARLGGIGIGEPDVAQQVDHHCGRVLPCRAERQVGEDAHLLLELRGDACIDRVVAAVVRPGRDFVDQQIAAGIDEHFHAENSAIAERDGHPLRDCVRAVGQVR